ncbi:hypothetical protein, partial [Nocardioides sp.]|uniref:hypothetical protein n=1 Tax=Nocardioides sp. TaxID=35761 RepID=UPI002C53B46D
TESSASIAAYAAAILAANATPARCCNSLVLPVVDARSHAHGATLDLYDKVHVTYSDKVNADYRITALEHQITPKKWIVGYSFEVVGSVAAPQLVPAPPATPGGLPWRDVYRAAAQSVATSTFAKVLWDTNRTPAISMAYSSGTFTADRAGIYEVRGVITFASNATGSRIARILAAGTEVYRNTIGTNPSSLTSVPFSDSVRLAAGDTLEIEAWQNSGGSLDVIGSAAGSKATITYLRA